MASRREFLRVAAVTATEAAAAAGASLVALGGAQRVEAAAAPLAEQSGPPFEQGKYQTFPRQVVEIAGKDVPVKQLIDLGTLGPDVDTIFGIDFAGDLETGALVVFQPTGAVTETRVVGIKRTDLETVQFAKALGGDRFDEHKVSEWGGDSGLDTRAHKHAENTARDHQKVVYVGDLGLFQRLYGQQEAGFLRSIIRAQRWTDPSLDGLNGIPRPDFVNSRSF